MSEMKSASSKTYHSNIVEIGHTVQNIWSKWTIKLIMLIMQIAQHMQSSIRQFLYAGDPYFTFLQ